MSTKSTGCVGAIVTVALIAIFAAPHAASAQEVAITITGTTDPTVTFDLPASPIPDATTANYFQINSVAALQNGLPVTLVDLRFYIPSDFGGLSYGSTVSITGPQYYSGTNSNPTFIDGIYLNQTNQNDGSVDTVTIGAVPEPSSWALLFVGLGGTGLLRRAKRPGYAA